MRSGFGVVVGVVLLAALCLRSGVAAGEPNKLELKKVYTHPARWDFGGARATPPGAELDPTGRYLYIFEGERAKLRIVDWRQDKLIKRVDLSDLPCGWDNPEQFKNDPYQPIYNWRFLPRTNLVALSHCDSALLIDAGSFALVRTLTSPPRDKGRVLFSPAGDFALVTRIESETQNRSMEFRKTETWEFIAGWTSSPLAYAFTPDGKYVVEIAVQWDRPYEDKRFIAGVLACSVTFREVPSGQIVHEWERTPEGAPCPKSPPLLVTRGTRYSLIGSQVGPKHKWAIHIWDGWTGELTRIVEATPYSLTSTLSVSPDGRYVVAGTWDDPQDNPSSADFTIWSLDSGEVVYQSPRYRSKWGPNTGGQEVYPSFAEDGRHLLVVTTKGIDIYEIKEPPE